jgi:hypothetical protein
MLWFSGVAKQKRHPAANIFLFIEEIETHNHHREHPGFTFLPFRQEEHKNPG